jgi:Ca-activated chloride channel homolog
MRSLYRRLIAAATCAFIVAGIGPARAADEGALIVIVDGSGSMWGQIDGTRQTKLVIAREALRRGLGKFTSQARIGLAVFGHRRGDCTDVEVVRPPEAPDVTRLMEPLEQFNPRGRGPITLAVREAAKSLPKDARPRTLLLIHDDADNCQPDLCSAAAELRDAKITAHVVGLAVKPDDMAKMACLPLTTGGRHFNAQNAEQAASYIEEALLLSASEMGGVQTTGTQPQAAIVPPQPVPASGPPALHLRALLAPNTEPVATPLFWTVAPEERPDAPLFGARAGNPVVPVAPGRYIVEVKDGAVSAKQTVEVKANRPASVSLVLNAASIRVRALARKNSGPLPDALVTAVDGNGALLLAAATGDTLGLVPAGKVVARAELGQVRAEQTVTVTAGRLFVVDIPLNVARLEVATAVRNGAFELDAPVFSILEDDPDAPGGRREIARSAAQPAEFVLPPGTYYAVARQGAVEARERLAVGPGDVARRVLSASAGTLALTTRAAGLAEAPISYRLVRTDGQAQDAIVTSVPSPTLLLPSGRYRAEGRYGLMNARTARDVEVKAGQAQQLVLEHEAAALRLRIAGGGPADVSWVVQDQAGRIVWTGAQPEALTTLQAGSYVVRADARGKRVERKVDLKAGETRLLEVPVD